LIKFDQVRASSTEFDRVRPSSTEFEPTKTLQKREVDQGWRSWSCFSRITIRKNKWKLRSLDGQKTRRGLCPQPNSSDDNGTTNQDESYGPQNEKPPEVEGVSKWLGAGSNRRHQDFQKAFLHPKKWRNSFQRQYFRNAICELQAIASCFL